MNGFDWTKDAFPNVLLQGPFGFQDLHKVLWETRQQCEKGLNRHPKMHELYSNSKQGTGREQDYVLILEWLQSLRWWHLYDWSYIFFNKIELAEVTWKLKVCLLLTGLKWAWCPVFFWMQKPFNDECSHRLNVCSNIIIYLIFWHLVPTFWNLDFFFRICII